MSGPVDAVSIIISADSVLESSRLVQNFFNRLGLLSPPLAFRLERFADDSVRIKVVHEVDDLCKCVWVLNQGRVVVVRTNGTA